MTLSKKDLEQITAVVQAVIKSESQDNKKADKGAKISGKPKDLVPSSKRPEIIKGLTMNERIELWGDINKDNIFGNRYKCARKLYKSKNIDGRPNIPYTEAYNEFLVKIANHNKYTKKQMTKLKSLVLKQLDDKIKAQKNPKAQEWLEKAVENIKG